ncbi:hypothetical protein AMJ83_10910 [candidate division WOR_3 bacterium SM23_42]|uniref:Dipeptidylpeptidase IV N-terminal domain-containing protein n=1 Tax=candidate division WOR_3 bacterium SM23_42 TaxID=1703779 RepID=A0A0S8FNX0_UNCW3|nr:MAG: hypothetical protein AMJ83_10910 [candidate division WOR_3 bacterium SM23_42]
MIFLFLINVCVFQNGDTLLFKEDDKIVETMSLAKEETDTSSGQIVIRQAKVSPNNKAYFIHEAVREVGSDRIVRAEISVFDARKNKILEEKTAGQRNLSYELSSLHDSLLIVASWDYFFNNPSIVVIKGDDRIDVVEVGQWQKVVSYKVSPHNQYMLFHTRNPYRSKSWDYIYFYDFKTGKSWDYLFPTCLSCKKTRIYLNIDDNGRSEVVHKNEHRIFSKDGVLEDIFLKLQ